MQIQNGNLKLRCEPVDPANGLHSGSIVTIKINAAESQKAIFVPANCIIPETRFKKIAIIKSGHVELIQVETGFRGNGQVEITSGIQPGDTFAVSGILYLKPGSEIKTKSILKTDQKE